MAAVLAWSVRGIVSVADWSNGNDSAAAFGTVGTVAFATAMEDENKRLLVLRDQSGITRTVKYTRPITLRIQISSPQMAQYTLLIQELDRLMMAIDSLWMKNQGARPGDGRLCATIARSE